MVLLRHIGKALLRAAFEANLPLLGGLRRANSTIDSRVLGPAAAVVDRRVGQLPKYVLVGAPSSAAGVAARGRPGVRVPISQSDQESVGRTALRLRTNIVPQYNLLYDFLLVPIVGLYYAL